MLASETMETLIHSSLFRQFRGDQWLVTFPFEMIEQRPDDPNMRHDQRIQEHKVARYPEQGRMDQRFHGFIGQHARRDCPLGTQRAEAHLPQRDRLETDRHPAENYSGRGAGKN